MSTDPTPTPNGTPITSLSPDAARVMLERMTDFGLWMLDEVIFDPEDVRFDDGTVARAMTPADEIVGAYARGRVGRELDRVDEALCHSQLLKGCSRRVFLPDPASGEPRLWVSARMRDGGSPVTLDREPEVVPGGERVDSIRSEIRLIAAGLARHDGELDLHRLSERWG